MEVIEISRYRSYASNPVRPTIPKVKAAVKASNFRYWFFCFLLTVNFIVISMFLIDYYGKAFQSEYDYKPLVETSGAYN